MTPDSKTRIVSVPWPVRLFGDLQHSLGLPAITAAVDLRTAVGASPRADGLCTVKAPWMPEPLPFDPRDPAAIPPQAPWMAGLLRVMKAEKVELPGGFDFQILSRAPWTLKLADSPALATAWTLAFLSLAGRLEKLSGNETAAFVCRVYQEEMPHARWMPEIYACVLGGMLFLEPGRPEPVQCLDRTLPASVICRPGKTAADADRRARAVANTLAALEKMPGLLPTFSLRETPTDDVIPRLRELPDQDAGVMYGHLVARDLCRQAFELLESEYAVDDDRLGEMLDKQHEMLRDYLGYSVPEIEALIPAAVAGGALGCKIILGTDSFLAVALGREKAVIASVKKAGGEAYPVASADGMRLETLAASPFGKAKSGKPKSP